MKITENLKENFPFISVINHVDKEYVGIIINQDAAVTSMYNYESLRSEEEKQRFLELGEVWWWESNRQIPINVFLKQDWEMFRICLKTFNSKDVEIIHGPYVSLKEMSMKRSKRRSITLVRKVDSN